MDDTFVYVLEVIWSTHKADAYFNGKYFVIGQFLFNEYEMKGIYQLREWSRVGIIDEMYGRYVSEKKIWQDTTTRL